ncbi:pyridoxamine phosphate oxidase family protein [Xylariaceae sp. FL1272]|nr:pyridoxamine phosphate oxidase family protein [Xylariaceae sp. FL1272]
MGQFFEEIPENILSWVLTQKIFWVSTAPLAGNGHVNVSPKGGDCFFRVPDKRTFLYHDMTGSGSETISHLLEPGNGRITIMFNAFDGPPRIVRFWGKGRVLEYGSPDFNHIIERENITPEPGTRSIILVDIHQVGSSCGYQVPFFNFVKNRDVLENHFKKKRERYEQGNEKESMDRYWALKNAWSIDGLPGMQRGLVAGRQFSIEPIQKMVGPLAPKNGGSATRAELHASYLVIAFLITLIAILAATHPVFEFFPAQKRMQELMTQITYAPGSPSASA